MKANQIDTSTNKSTYRTYIGDSPFEQTSTAAEPQETSTAQYINPNYQQGWVCPRCGRVNAPWMGQCNCQDRVFRKITTWADSGIPAAFRNCSNHPSNGGSGICHCTLGTTPITCSSNSYTTTSTVGPQITIKAREYNGPHCIN